MNAFLRAVQQRIHAERELMMADVRGTELPTAQPEAARRTQAERTHVRKAPGQPARTRMPEEDRARCEEMRKGGMSVEAIAEALGWSRTTICRALGYRS